MINRIRVPIFHMMSANSNTHKSEPQILQTLIRHLNHCYTNPNSQTHYAQYIDKSMHKPTKNEYLILSTKRILILCASGQLDYARKLFDEMSSRDLVTWNVMIKGYIENHRISDARELFDEMPERDSVSWNSMIMGYAEENLVYMALKLFVVMPGKDVVSWTAMVSGFCLAGWVSDGLHLFREMPERNVVSWASIMAGFQQNGLAAETLCLFKEMLCSGFEPNAHSFTSALAASGDLAMISVSKQLYLQLLKRGFHSNVHVGNSMVSMFIKCGAYVDAKRIFVNLPQRNLVTWNSMITGYAQHGYGLTAIMMFHQMQKAQILPDRISFLGVLQACCYCGFVNEGKQSFQSMVEDFGIVAGPEHYACMVDLLARAGLLKEAYQIIMEMPFEPTLVFWRIILSGCRIWRDLDLGVYAAQQVLRLEPANTSACLVLMDIYAFAGRWDEVFFLRKQLIQQEARKELGCSWVEVRETIHLFTSRDETHPESDKIYKTIQLLSHDIMEHVMI